MSECVKPYSRTPQVIGALYKYGPLNRKVLMDIIEPSMTTRRANACLQRLAKRNLIFTCNKVSGSFAQNYYQLASHKAAKVEVAKILGCENSSLNIPTFRGHEIEHSIICAYWSEYFCRLYPQAEVVRDFHISSNEEISNRLAISRDIEMFPDIIIFLKNKESDISITIAVEIERSHKARSRIFHKLNKFSTRSYIDGIIYLCPTPALNDLIGSVYVNNLKSTARRIRQYGDFFLMLSNTFEPVFNSDLSLFSSSGNNINLNTWINTLLSTEWQKRRDDFFKTGATLGSSLAKAAQ